MHSRSVVPVVHQGTDADSRRQCHASEQQAADENATDDYRHACGVVVPEAARARWGPNRPVGDRLHRQLWVRFSVWVRFLTGCGWHGWAGGVDMADFSLSGAMTCQESHGTTTTVPAFRSRIRKGLPGRQAGDSRPALGGRPWRARALMADTMSSVCRVSVNVVHAVDPSAQPCADRGSGKSSD